VTENSPELKLLNSANIGMGMFGQFARVESGGAIIMPDVRFVHQVQEMHIYSFSDGDLATPKAMCVDAPVPYNACLRIKDEVALMKAIIEKGTLPEHGNIQARAFFTHGAIGRVEYKPLSRNIRSGPVIPPSPLAKDTRFASQSEIRIALFPAKEGLPRRIVIKIPDPSEHFELVFRDYEVAKMAEA
jgi:hypothetical protein